MTADGPIVITGTGVVTALGLSVAQTWHAVQHGACGIGPLDAVESPLAPDKGGGQAPALPQGPSQPRRELAYLTRAMDEALAQAGLLSSCPYAAQRRGIVLGTTLGGMRSGGVFLRTNEPKALGTFLAASVLAPLAAHCGAAGVTISTSAACASGLASLGLAATLLEAGVLDLVLAGGYDPISEYAYSGFNSLRLVAEGPARPFSAGRQGMKLGEGYGIVALERAADAKRRGASVVAVLSGYAETSDAHHLTQPRPDGEGAARCMRAALAAARLEPDRIGLISAHATGTPDNDGAEHAALQRVFGTGLNRIPVVALKSHLGHTLGGAGAIELILTAEAMRRQLVPPTPNVSRDQLEFADLRFVTGGAAQPAPIESTMSLSLGFGGANSCAVLSRANGAAAVRPRRRDVFITGVSAIAPGIVSNDALAGRLAERRQGPLAADAGSVDEGDLDGLLQARRVRRMSTYVKLVLAAARVALDDARVSDCEAFAATCGALLATTHGATTYAETYYRQVVREGVAAANPMLFAEAVPNVASAHLSILLGLRGSAQTITGSRTAGLDALQLAVMRIASGEWERALVGAAEEYSPVVNRAYEAWGHYAARGGGTPFENGGGFRTGAGAAVIVLESGDSARARGARVRGRVESIAAAHWSGGARVPDLLAELDDPPQVICSASGSTLDRIERAVLRHSARRARHPLIVSSLYGHLAETFSVNPLAALAAGLTTGTMPSLATAHPWPAAGRSWRAWRGGMRGAQGTEPLQRFGVLCTDVTGPIRALSVALQSLPPRPPETARLRG